MGKLSTIDSFFERTSRMASCQDVHPFKSPRLKFAITDIAMPQHGARPFESLANIVISEHGISPDTGLSKYLSNELKGLILAF